MVARNALNKACRERMALNGFIYTFGLHYTSKKPLCLSVRRLVYSIHKKYLTLPSVWRKHLEFGSHWEADNFCNGTSSQPPTVHKGIPISFRHNRLLLNWSLHATLKLLLCNINPKSDTYSIGVGFYLHPPLCFVE